MRTAFHDEFASADFLLICQQAGFQNYLDRPLVGGLDHVAKLAQNIFVLAVLEPADIDYDIGLDTTQAITEGMREIMFTFLAALTLVVYSAFLAVMRVPYALVLGPLGGLLEFIPVVGPMAAAVLIVGVAVLSGYSHWLALIVFLACWRLIQDYVSSPRIMGDSMELHPLAAIFGVMAGGEVAGILGIFLSIPVMASLRIVFRRWRLYAEKRKFGPLNEYALSNQIGRPK